MGKSFRNSNNIDRALGEGLMRMYLKLEGREETLGTSLR